MTQEEQPQPTPLTTINRAIVDQIQANLIAYFRIFAGLPGVTFVEEAKVTWNMGGPGPHILRTQFAQEAVDQQIDELIRQIGQHSANVDWFVFPSCRPPDLGERVAARGLAGGPNGEWALVGKIGGPGGNWLLADLATLPNAPVAPDAFHVEFVRDKQMLGEWLDVSLSGFGGIPPMPEKRAESHFYAGYACHGFGADASSLHYIGYLDQQPVTAATLCLAGGIAGLFDISTPPEFRRQGFGSAISWALLQEAQKRGVSRAYVWSSTMGQNVYRGVGFVPIELGMREYQWQKR